MRKSCISAIAGVLLVFSCSDPAPKKTYTVYEFGTIDNSKIHSDAGKLHSITASGKGLVYVAGQADDNTVMIDRTADGSTWEKLDLTTGKTPDDAHTRSFATKKSKARVTVTGSLHDGIIVYEPESQVIGILEDGKVGATTAWKYYVDGNLYLPPRSFVEREEAGQYFILATLIYTPKEGIGLFERGVKVNPWQNGFKRVGTNILHTVFTSSAITGQAILLSGEDGHIYKMDEQSLKTKHLANNGDPVVQALSLQHDGQPNSKVSKMLMVGKYLLVGFEKGETSQGGLFYKDISSGLPITSTEQWENTGDGLGITGMVIDRNNPQRAVISTNMGVMIFENGRVEHFTKFMVKSKANQGSLKEGEPKNGLTGDLESDYMFGVAQGQDGKFYFATSDGVATMEITTKDW